MKEEEIKKLNIYEKLSLITEEIGIIEKKLTVGTGANTYKAVSERDVLDNIKPIEKKYRVYSYPESRTLLESDILTKETEYKGEVKKVNQQFMRIETKYKFINLDNPEDNITTITYGDGIDTGDKAPGKAMTYADKYALMKAYKLSTGDDPDKDASPEDGYKKVEKKASQKQVDMLEKYYKGENLEKLLKENNIKKLEDIGMTKASEIIKKIMDRAKLINKEDKAMDKQDMEDAMASINEIEDAGDK